MTFKESISGDIDSIFFDLNTFGESHTIDELEITIIVDNEQLKKRTEKSGINADGIFADGVLFFAKIRDLGGLPKVGSVMEFDGELFRVADSKSYDGVAEIVLEANLS